LSASGVPPRPLRLRIVATKNRPCADFPFRAGDAYEPGVALDLDYGVLLPRQVLFPR
jgi:2-methylfumaryl-CoA hydratase